MSKPVKDSEEWHKIGEKLTAIFGVCSCQRKLKSIVDSLYNIYEAYAFDENIAQRVPKIPLTGSDYLLIALLDKFFYKEHKDSYPLSAIEHGTNIEYPSINKEHPLWKFVLEVKDSPYLEDN